jgi:amino acid transporter
LTISVVAVLLLANLVDLSAIASLGSAVALAIFLMVAVAGMRLRRETGSSRGMIVTAVIATSVVLIVFGIQTLLTEPETFAAILAVLLLAVALEFVWSVVRQGRDTTDADPAESGQEPAPDGS